MAAETRPTVVVGTDGSDAAQAAVEYAADLAARRRLPLRVLHAFEASQHELLPARVCHRDRQEVLRRAAQQMLDQTREVLPMAYPDLECRPSSSPVHRSTCSWRSHGMRTASWSAGGERAGSPRCCSGPHRSTCAPRPAAPSSPSRHRTSSTRVRREVVVGVEGSAGTETRPRVRLQRRGRDRSAAGGGAGVVRTRPGGLRISLVSDRDEVGRATRRSSSRPTWPPGPAGKFPRYGSSRWSSPGHPAEVLLWRARKARLLVVGSRGRSSLRNATFGSVSHAVVHHATRPVAVVPAGI